MTYTLPPPRNYRNTYQRSHSRRVLAWLAFAALYIALPLALVAGIYALTAAATQTADRADAFYQQTKASIIN